ncbi:hypothetical protein PsorP6_000499 [Peronosclerospora sorghi]|uniref:Uncharacterized protein n=1 Tax=Peronosclerospora sorghi TaxID=230839 RepID=A0ACC0WS55_9STRA|nr:hypothetical protein PsorP6_000499 [Peronosclerospora sorghi]
MNYHPHPYPNSIPHPYPSSIPHPSDIQLMNIGYPLPRPISLQGTSGCLAFVVLGRLALHRPEFSNNVPGTSRYYRVATNLFPARNCLMITACHDNLRSCVYLREPNSKYHWEST